MTFPSVLVGSPITASKHYKRYCLEEYLYSISKINYDRKTFCLLLNGHDGDDFIYRYPRLNIQRSPKTANDIETVVMARNILRDEAIKKNYDYLFFLEQDIIFPENILTTLLNHKKPVCCALYFNQIKLGEKKHNISQVNTTYPMAWNFDKNHLQKKLFHEKPINKEDLINNPLIRVDVCGLGATLIHQSVLEKIQFRFDPDEGHFEEFYFARDCYLNSIPIFLDTQMICGHHTARGLI